MTKAIVNALKMVGVASKAASAGLTTTETSVTALSSLMNAYNRKTLKDSIEFSDQLLLGSNNNCLSDLKFLSYL